MDAVEFKRYKDIFNNSDLPEELGSHLQEISREGKTVYRLLFKNGRCMFLSDNKCYIHNHHGPEAKSRTCNRFPLAVDTYTPRGMHLKTSFICPAILNSLLKSDKIQLNKAEWENDFTCPENVKFCDNYNVPWDSFFSLSDALARIFLQESYHVEQNLVIAGIWASGLYNKLKQGKIKEFNEMSAKEYLGLNKKSFLNAGEEFSPQCLEQINLIANIAQVLMAEEFMNESESSGPLKVTSLLRSREAISGSTDTIQHAYGQQYLEELSGFSPIIERYLLNKILSLGLLARNGIVFGINHMVLCYSFIRLIILAEIISGKTKLDVKDILEAIRFVELIFFHRRSMEYLQSSKMLHLLSKPLLSLLLIKL